MRHVEVIPKHRIRAMKSMLSSAAPAILFAQANVGSLDHTISCLSPPRWNIVLKISATTLRSGSSSTARKAARQRSDLVHMLFRSGKLIRAKTNPEIVIGRYGRQGVENRL